MPLVGEINRPLSRARVQDVYQYMGKNVLKHCIREIAFSQPSLLLFYENDKICYEELTFLHYSQIKIKFSI